MNPALIERTLQRAVACRDAGEHVEAARLFRKVLASFPDAAVIRCELGNVLFYSGNPQGAITEFRRALRSAPQLAEPWNYLGTALHATGKLDEARDAYCNALRARPAYPEALVGLGDIEAQRGLFDAATGYFQQALAMNPENVAAQNGLGRALATLGRAEQAAGCFQQALRLAPGTAVLHYNLANALRDTGRHEEAVSHYQQAIEAQPGAFEFHNNLGNLLLGMARPSEALVHHQHCLALRPKSAEALTNVGNCFLEMREFEPAIEHFRRALQANPDAAGAHNNLGMALLTTGNFAEGLQEFEWRWRQPSFSSPVRNFTAPQWDGGDLGGRTILLHAEQGYGDTIQFARYIPLVVGRGGCVVVECQSPLHRLLEGIEGVAEWKSFGDPLPTFDVHCPLMSLPFVFKTGPDNIPPVLAEIQPDTGAIAKWKERLSKEAPGLRVGLAWRGNPSQRDDRLRSILAEALAPLGAVDGVRFFSLQKDAAGAPLDAGMGVVDYTAELHDFAETGALIANLDLVISVCSAVAHLSGSLGCPTWTLLRFGADWRWQAGRDDSPWYPNMRLFRQTAPGDWSGVIERVAEALADRAARGG